MKTIYQELEIHVKKSLERYQAILEHGVPRGLATGFSLLDVLTNGLLPGRVYVVASRPSMGKTTLLLTILAEVCIKQKTPSMFFSGDLTISQIIDRLIFNRAKIPLCALYDPEYIPNKGELRRIQRCALDLAGSGLILDDSRDLTIEAIAANARDHRAMTGIGFIAIDHLHLIRSESTTPGTPRKCEMARVMREIKSLAQELDVPVLVSAQLKRRADGRLPRIGDIREAGAIEPEADFVGLLHREGTISTKNYYDLRVAKNSHGPADTVRLIRYPGLQWFEPGPPICNEEEEIEQAWHDYRYEKDFPPERA